MYVKRQRWGLPRRSVWCALLAVMVVLAPNALAAAGSKKAYVVMARGKIRGDRWVTVIDGSARKGNGLAEPCLTVVLERPSAPGLVEDNESRECSYVSDDLPFSQSVSVGRTGPAERTVLAMAFSPRARTVALDLGGRGRRTVSLQLMGSPKAKELGINPISYWAHAFSGAFCLHRFTAYTHTGRVLSDSGAMPCSGQ
jgi:hypothetical protein